MEQLLKQTRLKFSGVGQEKAEGTSDIRDRKIPPQKTHSFKGEKRSQSWLQRQLSKQTSQSDEYGSGGGSEDELAVAVAAAAIAVNKIEDSTTPDRTLQRQNTSRQLETGEKSRKRPDRKISIAGPAQPVQKRPSFAETLLESTEAAKGGAPPPLKPSPSIKRAPSSADKQFKKATSMKPEISPSLTSEPLPTIKPATPRPPEPKSRQVSAVPGGESKADAWMRQELSRIQERYDNLNSTIASWETQKKKKARRKLDATEVRLNKTVHSQRELERRRAKALQTFRAEMQRIEQVVGGARAQAVERQRNEELKARDKANRLRTTGKLPKKCFCF